MMRFNVWDIVKLKKIHKNHELYNKPMHITYIQWSYALVNTWTKYYASLYLSEDQLEFVNNTNDFYKLLMENE